MTQDASDFAAAVAEVIAGLHPGEVIAYGEVAAEAGRPGAARAVGRILATSGSHQGNGGLPGDAAWWRVVNASGRLAPGKEPEQARRLRAEGVQVEQRPGGWFVRRS